MNKSLMLISALFATSIAASASALDINVERALVVPGLTSIPGVPGDSLGTTAFTALGSVGAIRGACQYLMEWQSPFNPNDAQLCVVRERTTPFHRSCINNRQLDFTTVMSAGSGALYDSTYCAGFDNLGTAQDDVTLVLGESAAGISGIAIYEGAIPLVLPVESVTL